MKKQSLLLITLLSSVVWLFGQTAKVFYAMDQLPTTTANALVDATANTTGTLTNSGSGLPSLISGAATYSMTAWDLENSNAYIKVLPNATTTSLGDIGATSGLTIGFWANLTYDSGDLFHRLAGLGNTFDLVLVNAGIEFRFDGSTYVVKTVGGDNVFDGGWEHFAVSFDFTSATNNLVLYLDGVATHTISANVGSSFASASNALIIGARSNESYHFPGKLDEFVVFDEVLDATEVQSLYQNGAYQFCDPSTCTYGSSIQTGGFTYNWANYDNNETTGLGNRAVTFDFSEVCDVRLAPPSGIHPRVYFNPEQIPAIQDRLANTTSGQAIAAQIHAYTTLLHLGYSGGGTYNHNTSYGRDPDGNRWIDNAGLWNNEPFYSKLIAQDGSVFSDPSFDAKRKSFVASIMALEAFECLMNAGGTDADTNQNYDDRAVDLATAQAFWANYALTDPSVGPDNNDFRNFPATHLGLTYDLNHHAMTTAQRDVIRQALVKVIPDAPRHGKDMVCYANTSNWSTLNSFEILPNLAIEGEAGYKAGLTHDWMRALHNFMTYGWYASGAGYEGLGKNYQMATTLVAAAKRGYSLLGHPHVRAYAQDFLPAITQPFGHAFTSYDVWGGSGYDPEIGGYKFNSSDAIGLKWIFPNNPKVDFMWRNYIQRAYNLSSEGYVYQQIRPDDSYLNYLVPAAVFALDYDDSDFNTQAATAIPTDYFAADRGLAIIRNGTDADDLSTQFHCRQDMGGHTHGDRNDFTLSALGRIWVRKTYGGSQFQPIYFHSGILIDDKGMGVGDPDGDKCRQPGKVLDYQSSSDLSCVTGDATYAYTWEWHWQGRPSTQDHSWLGTNGWEKVLETWNDFQYQPQAEAQYNVPFYDFPHWHQDGNLERMVKREYNPMQRIIRTLGVVKGEHPFLLVVDDVQKDADSHNYKWVAQVANDLVIESTNIQLDDCDYKNDIILKEPDATGNRRLLVRVLNNEGFTGAGTPGYLEPLAYNDFFSGNPYNPNPNFSRQRLVVENNSVAPNFRVLLYPFQAGEALPKTSWNTNRDSLVVAVGDTEHLIAFEAQTGGWHKLALSTNNPFNQVQVRPKALLQGAYTGTLMRNELNTQGLMPLTEPFTASGYTHIGEGGNEIIEANVLIPTGNDAIVDWVLVELRDKDDPSIIRSTRSALIQRDGDIVDLDGTSPVTFKCMDEGEYHIAILHRNHLGVMTAMPIYLSN